MFRLQNADILPCSMDFGIPFEALRRLQTIQNVIGTASVRNKVIKLSNRKPRVSIGLCLLCHVSFDGSV